MAVKVDKKTLKSILSQALPKGISTMVSMVKRLPTVKEALPSYIERNYLANPEQTSEKLMALRNSLLKSKASGVLCGEILKQIYDERSQKFDCLLRVVSGTIKSGQRVRVLG